MTCLTDDPQWCQWNEWSPCTATCTGINSMQVRQRACLCPAPKTIQEHCDGRNSFEKKNGTGFFENLQKDKIAHEQINFILANRFYGIICALSKVTENFTQYIT